jgi:hypothetical protein
VLQKEVTLHIGEIAKLILNFFTKRQIRPQTFNRVNIVPQLPFSGQKYVLVADVVLHGGMR